MASRSAGRSAGACRRDVAFVVVSAKAETALAELEDLVGSRSSGRRLKRRQWRWGLVVHVEPILRHSAAVRKAAIERLCYSRALIKEILR